ncbi:hypothetical protein JFU24_29450 [Peribacillus sp. TH27]|nr:hypothetical protein [Peribacillus sp. TH27]
MLKEYHGEILQDKGILYAPDYIANCGGLIQVADELYGPNKEQVLQKTRAIYDSLLKIYDTSQKRNITTTEAANGFCEARLRSRKNNNSFFLHNKRPKWQVN